MTERRSYWQLYLAAVVAWTGMFLIPRSLAIYRAEALHEEKYYEGLDDLSLEQFQEEVGKIRMLTENPTDDVRDYFQAESRLADLEIYGRKGERRASKEEVFRWRSALGWGMSRARMDLHAAYAKKHGRQHMAAAAAAIRGGLANPHPMPLNSFAPGSAPETWPLMRSIWIAWLPFGVFITLLRLYQAGLSVTMEIFGAPWRLIPAVLLSPFSLLFYPRGSRAEQIIGAMRLATMTLGTAISAFAGVAKAETSKDSSRKDSKRDPWSLQLDARAGRFVDSTTGPDPNGSLRATLTAPTGTIFETINVKKQGFHLNWTAVGHPIRRFQNFTLYGVAGTTFNSTGSTSLMAGLQLYGGNPHIGVAIPEFTLERELRPVRSTTFANTSMAWVKRKRLFAGVETALRKPLVHGKASWTKGPFAGVMLGKGAMAQGAFLKNGSSPWRARLRLMYTFSW